MIPLSQKEDNKMQLQKLSQNLNNRNRSQTH